MALLGNVESNFGLNATYHMIKCFNWVKDKSISIEVFSFADQAARLANKDPMMIRTYSVDNSVSINDVTLMLLYDKLKLISDFSGMSDV